MKAFLMKAKKKMTARLNTIIMKLIQIGLSRGGLIVNRPSLSSWKIKEANRDPQSRGLDQCGLN